MKNLRQALIQQTIQTIGIQTLVADYNKEAKKNGRKAIAEHTAIRYSYPGSAQNPPFIKFVASVGKNAL